MKVALLVKKNKMTVLEIVEYVKNRFSNVDIYMGNVSDPIPENLFEKYYDIIISYLSPWIVPEKILKKTKLWNINFHPAPPEYPGIGCFNFAIYNNEKQYGVTSHLMEKKVDTGSIIGVKRFPLLESDTVYTLSIKTYGYLFCLFVDVTDYIVLKNNIPFCDENWTRVPYTRKELEELCKIDLSMKKSEIIRRVKATSFPDMPGAYIELFGHKFEHKTNG